MLFFSNSKNHKHSKGFTLIELLVVISIIGLLSSIVLASLSSARTKAKDTRRLSDLRNIQKGMELFYASNNQYPDQTDVDCGWDVGNIGADPDPFISELETAEIFSKTPREMSLFLNSAPCYGYTYIYRKFGSGTACNNGKPFAILAILFEQTHAQLGLPTDEIDACGCGVAFGGDTCTHDNRFGIMFKE